MFNKCNILCVQKFDLCTNIIITTDVSYFALNIFSWK